MSTYCRECDCAHATGEHIPRKLRPEQFFARENIDYMLATLRGDGWLVAVHNDYRQSGEQYTFWLFTKGDRCIKGEAATDTEALRQCIVQSRK
jgi:hypothetical protein